MKSRLLIVLLLLVWPLGFAHAQYEDYWEGLEAFDGPTDTNPILAAQIDFYFDRFVAPLPDSITLEISRLIERTSYNTDLRDFFLWHLLERYRHPDYMTQDQMFVWLYDHYFSQLEIKDLNDVNRSLIKNKAERLRRLALSNPAPEFSIDGSDGETIELSSIEGEPIVLLFYDHDCDLCQQELRDLDSVCLTHPGITALAIDLNTDDTRIDALYELYDIEATPLLYVLDKEKRIIAKKIRARQIPLMID